MDDAPVAYLERIRTYYETLGYGAPYVWAHYATVPFQPLAATARRMPGRAGDDRRAVRAEKGDQGPGAPYNAAAKFYDVYSMDTGRDPDLRISHVAIDRDHTTAEDQGRVLPARRAATGRGRRAGSASVAPRFHGLPTNRSHRTTLEVDCPELVARCRADGADAAILVANCPVCHQSVGLAARALEEQASRRSSSGCAKDIVEHVGVPRFLFSDFPLGNAAGPSARSGVAGAHPRPRAGAAGRRTRARGRRCSRRCAGATMPPGSSTTATSTA